jgi:hypothetical protein
MKIFLSSLAILLAFNTFAQPAMGSRQAVTLMGKLRLLTQKITNAKVYLVTEGQIDKFKKEYETNVQLFAENIKALQKYSPTKGIKKRTEYIGTYWESFKVTAQNLDSSKKSILNFVRNSESLYTLCDDAMAEMVKHAFDVNTTNSEETRNQETITKQINNVSKVRLGLTRIPLTYNLFIGGYDVNYTKNLLRSNDNITQGLTALAAAEINNATADAAIAATLADWNSFKAKYFKKGLLQFSDLRTNPVNMFDDVSAMQTKLDKITFAYVSLAQ